MNLNQVLWLYMQMIQDLGEITQLTGRKPITEIESVKAKIAFNFKLQKIINYKIFIIPLIHRLWSI